MAKAPDQPAAPKRARDPAKHSKKDPARPTRAKAARPEQPPMEPALADLLNPGIAQGTAGPGSQTGLKPPADNSFDRRADFCYPPGIFDLQAVKRIVPVADLGDSQISVGVANDLGERSHC